jgi:hypothetical protein
VLGAKAVGSPYSNQARGDAEALRLPQEAGESWVELHKGIYSKRETTVSQLRELRTPIFSSQIIFSL